MLYALHQNINNPIQTKHITIRIHVMDAYIYICGNAI